MHSVSRTYPKGTDADPAAAERERMRALARELHEAAQDARDAARELRAERAATTPQIVTETKAAAQMAILAIDGHVAHRSALMSEQAAGITEQLSELYNSFLTRLGELADNELDQEGIEAFMTAAVLRATRSAEFITRVVNAVAEEISGEPSLCTPTGWSPTRQRGQVFVGTPDGLAAFRAAGGDPGFVLDART
jgi:hypothetical protein